MRALDWMCYEAVSVSLIICAQIRPLTGPDSEADVSTPFSGSLSDRKRRIFDRGVAFNANAC